MTELVGDSRSVRREVEPFGPGPMTRGVVPLGLDRRGFGRAQTGPGCTSGNQQGCRLAQVYGAGHSVDSVEFGIGRGGLPTRKMVGSS